MDITAAERKDHNDDGLSAGSTASATTMSPNLAPLHVETTDGPDPTVSRLPAAAIGTAIGTPSTVSTAPSTDDASVEGMDPVAFERLSIKVDEVPQNQYPSLPRAPSVQSLRVGSVPTQNPIEAPRQSRQDHQRTPSWEDVMSGRNPAPRHGIPQGGQQVWPKSQIPPFGSSPSRHVEAWNGPVSTHARVASFRSEGMVDHGPQYGYPPQVPHTDAWRQQRRFAEPQHLIGPHQQGQMVHLPPSGAYTQPRKAPYGPHPSMTPTRGRQGRTGQTSHRQVATPSSTQGSAGNPNTTNPPRSSSEILKTLLRKKACLYEPDTSRAVALVTWLVGRELALEYGYFSRQQLQTGVHACVSKKIDSGTITRTKVNRCMQIILNSCFHYIIPRPDGSEENGESFRTWFAESTRDDTALLLALPPPWNDIVVDKKTILSASVSDPDTKSDNKQSPQGSPRLPSVEQREGQGDGGENLSKRAVLLCFNENVRSAEDVFRCHNEFIRDTANASKLQLTAHEWRTFFGQDATSTPALWGSAPGESVNRGGSAKPVDFLGRMDQTELCKFRETWCAKRYDHDHELCGFAHVEVNGGWLRRNPRIFSYREEMCPCIVNVPTKSGQKGFYINECPKGVKCEFAHSMEEILYHPNAYKKKGCKMVSQGCPHGDVCPYLHPQDSGVHVKKQSLDARNQPLRHAGNRQQGTGYSSNGAQKGAANVPPPNGAPMLYVNPAPFSSFESQLGMPGLQNLFRRNSCVVAAYLKNNSCAYSNFGDDWGIIKTPEKGERSILPRR